MVRRHVHGRGVGGGIVPLVLLVTASAGCGSGLVPAEGLVLLDGQPLAGATVTFMPQAEGRPASAVTGADGRFKAALPDGKGGLAPGEYRVVVMLVKQAVLASGGEAAETASGGGGPPVEYIVPQRFGNPETSGLTASLSRGATDLRFELVSKPEPANPRRP
jgi:hypothetical protein